MPDSSTSNLVAARALIFSRLDYCNALLAGLPHITLAPLQRIINAAVRLVDGLRPRDHVTAAAMALRWLPVASRIEYKLCLLVHLALVRKVPTYIRSLLQPISACRLSMTLRSATAAELFTPRSRLQEAQLSQRDRATLCVIEYVAKSLKVIRKDTVSMASISRY